MRIQNTTNGDEQGQQIKITSIILLLTAAGSEWTLDMAQNMNQSSLVTTLRHRPLNIAAQAGTTRN